MAADVLSFAEALEETQEGNSSKPHVLLGNGFSIACRPDRFSYAALLDEVSFDGASADLRRIFEILGTTDFERVIEFLQLSAEVWKVYGVGNDRCKTLIKDAETVRESLSQVLAARHPDLPNEISDDEYRSCRTFLSNFDRIYTVNYDMLLYWTLMRVELNPDLESNDGFNNPEDDEAPYVAWEPYNDFQSQRVFFLHGGLHLYDKGNELVKITWARTGVPLVEQIREALSERRYPLVVTEGTSADKETKILHSAYLNHAIRSFSRIKEPLFIFGHSLSQNDSHILRRISRGRLRRLYVGLHGNPDSETNRNIVARAIQLSETRPLRRPLSVSFYDSSTANVWSI